MAKMSFSKALNASLNASIDALIDTKASKSTSKTARAKFEVDAVTTASSEPKLERAKLDTPDLVNRELRRLYRRFSNKQISAADLKARVAALGAIRDGMADPVENTGDFEPAIFNILSVPENRFLSGEDIAALRAGRSVVDIEQCRRLRTENSEQTNKIAEPQQVEPSQRELRNGHFRPEFHDPPPVEDNRERWLRQAHEDEAAGKSVIMRAPREDVYWPKPPTI